MAAPAAQVPAMPVFEVPRVPFMEMPAMPKFEMPEMPMFEMPDMSAFIPAARRQNSNVQSNVGQTGKVILTDLLEEKKKSQLEIKSKTLLSCRLGKFECSAWCWSISTSKL